MSSEEKEEETDQREEDTEAKEDTGLHKEARSNIKGRLTKPPPHQNKSYD